MIKPTTKLSPEVKKWLLKKQKQFALKVLKKLSGMGFYAVTEINGEAYIRKSDLQDNINSFMQDLTKEGN